MKRKCRMSGAPFEVLPEDLMLLSKLSPIIQGERFELPPPTLSPVERQRRRIAFRNERKLYHRKCSLTGKAIISMYSPDKPYTIYDQREWWSDKWDPTEYGRPFDFSRPFFEQFQELLAVVPRVALLNRNSVNCEYTNISADNKDCYLLVESSNNEACHYSYWMQRCSYCIDSAFCYLCERCYEITCCSNCYDLKFSKDCRECSESSFLQGCIGCSHCISCTNLIKREYCIFNEQYSKEDFFKLQARLALDTHTGTQVMRERFATFAITQPHRHAEILQSEECSGNYINQSKECFSCFHTLDAQECRYCVHVWRNAKDCMDCDTAGRDAELIYESINSGINVFHNLFCMTCWTCYELLYCDTCNNTHDCFGSVGLKQKEYCILNTPYSRSEYEKLLKKIIKHMVDTGEWGEFYPPSMSFYGYNESAAADFHPLSKEEALRRGFKWHEDDAFSKYQGAPAPWPESISATPDTVTKDIFVCETSSKPYKIIPQELSLYKSIGVPLPHCCPDQRHLDRLATRTPRTLYQRACSKCQHEVSTPYGPERRELIYCEECYREAV